MLINRGCPVRELTPLAGQPDLSAQAALTALLTPGDRVLLTGGEDGVGTWLRELDAASNVGFAFALELGACGGGGPSGSCAGAATAPAKRWGAAPVPARSRAICTALFQAVRYREPLRCDSPAGGEVEVRWFLIEVRRVFGEFGVLSMLRWEVYLLLGLMVALPVAVGHAARVCPGTGRNGERRPESGAGGQLRVDPVFAAPDAQMVQPGGDGPRNLGGLADAAPAAARARGSICGWRWEGRQKAEDRRQKADQSPRRVAQRQRRRQK